jgi:hypothetical protein
MLSKKAGTFLLAGQLVQQNHKDLRSTYTDSKVSSWAKLLPARQAIVRMLHENPSNAILLSGVLLLLAAGATMFISNELVQEDTATNK